MRTQTVVTVPDSGLRIEIVTAPNVSGEGLNGTISSNLKRGFCTAKEADTLESFLLALACEGYDMEDARMGSALLTTLEALAQ